MGKPCYFKLLDEIHECPFKGENIVNSNETICPHMSTFNDNDFMNKLSEGTRILFFKNIGEIVMCAKKMAIANNAQYLINTIESSKDPAECIKATKKLLKEFDC